VPLIFRHHRRPKTRRPIGARRMTESSLRRVRGRKSRNSSPPHLYLLYRASKATQRQGMNSCVTIKKIQDGILKMFGAFGVGQSPRMTFYKRGCQEEQLASHWRRSI
jgi:hypothetical protein